MQMLDVLAVIRAPLEQYPPSLNQVALLAEAGLRVGVIDLSHSDYRIFEFNGDHPVERFHAGRHTQLHKEPLPNAFVRFRRAWTFRQHVARLIQLRKPKVVIAYDPYGMWAVGPLWERANRPRLIWQFHELFLPDSGQGGLLTNKATAFACANAKHADMVVHADRGRAEVFVKAAGLPRFPEVVMNCPRLRESVPEESLSARLHELGHGGKRAVYFHGWIGTSRCMETTIESMSQWPNDTVLVLVGPVSKDYRRKLEELSEKRGVAKRMVFLGSVPYSEIWSLTAGASIGLSLVADQTDLNWIHSAGAINKRFEYMSVGLPQVANTGTGMAEIIKRPNCGLLVNPFSPEQIGLAVNSLLSDELTRRSMSLSAYAAHRDKFNYEHQFTGVLKMIREWCAPKADN